MFAPKRRLRWGAREARIGLLLLGAAWSTTVEPAAAAKKAHTGPVVTYTGLKVLNDGSSAFRVELSKNAVVVAKSQGKRVSFLIEDAKVARRNNMNPLEAAFFCVNLVKAQLNNTKHGVMVNLDLRDAAPVTFHLETVAEGALLEFSVPPTKTGASCK